MLDSDLTQRAKRLVLGLGGAQLIAIGVTPLLTRLYPVESFGLFTIFMAIANLIPKFVSLRYERAIVLGRDDRETFSLYSLSIVIVGAFFILGSLGWAAMHASGLGSPEIQLLAGCVVISLIVIGFNSATQMFLNCRDEHSAITRARLLEVCCTAAAQIGIGISAGTTGFGLIGGYLVGMSLANGYLILRMRVQRREARPFEVRYLKALLRRYRGFPLVNMWSGVLTALANRMPAFLLAAMFGTEAAGYYGLCQRVLSVPPSLIGQGFVMAIIKTGADARGSLSRFANVVEEAVGLLMLAAIVPYTIVTAFGPDLFAIIFGAQWKTAGQFAQILGVAVFLRFIVFPLTNVASVLERHGVLITWTGCRVILGTAAMYGFAWLMDSAFYGLIGFSAAQAVLMLAMLYWVMRTTRASWRRALSLAWLRGASPRPRQETVHENPDRRHLP